jgi:Family of unknown function (DUF6079)
VARAQGWSTRIFILRIPKRSVDRDPQTYLYFIQPFEPPRYTDEKKPDEVFFRLTNKDDKFTQSLKLYAAALELAAVSSGVKKQTYERKAFEHLAALTKWLSEHLLQSIEVTYQGSRRKFMEWLKGSGISGNVNIRDAVNAVSAKCLAEQFSNSAPEYPVFSTLVTYGRDGNALQAAQEAIRGIAQPNRTKQGVAILDALELLDGDKMDPPKSRYARFILDLLQSKGQGQVANRQEVIISLEPGVEFMSPDKFRLEPIWVSVLLSSLVYSGDAVLAIPGVKFDASSLPSLAATPVQDLQNFKHLERPKDWNIPSLVRHTVEQLRSGKLKDEYKRLDQIYQVGDKVASVYLRDVVSIFSLDECIPPDAATLLMPIDTHVKNVAIDCNIASAGMNDLEIREALVDTSRKVGVSPLLVNQGAWNVRKNNPAELRAKLHSVTRFSNTIRIRKKPTL